MERLSPQDLITLWPEQVGSPQDMGVVAVLGRGHESPEVGVLRIDAVRELIAGRLHLAPPLRQVIHTPPPGLGRPVWADSPAFDVAEHVREQAVPRPGGQAQLLRTVEYLRRTPLDLTRPLWEVWLLPGLADGRTGLYVRVHHALADGGAMIALLGAILDGSPDARQAPEWAPAEPPTSRDLIVDNVNRYRAAGRQAAAALAHPSRHRPSGWGPGSILGGSGIATQAPRTSLNRPIGRDRRFVVVRSALQPVQAAAHRYDASVNDVLLAAVGAGLRELLDRRGERTDHVALRAIVPVALPHHPQGDLHGNVLGQMIVSLPLDVADPLCRLREVAAQTAERRRAARPRHLPVLRSRALQRLAMTAATHQRAYNVYVANVRGPDIPLHLAGAELLEAFPLVPLLGNLTLGVGALSYAQQFNILTVADVITCPDVDVFAGALETELQVLTKDTHVAR